MPRLLTMKTSEFTIYEPGAYRAKLLRIEDDTGTYGPTYRFTWQLCDDDGQPTDDTMPGWCSQKLTPRSKLYDWYAAHMGRAPEEDEQIDVDDCIDRFVQLVLGKEPRADGTGDRNTIQAIAPIRRKASTGKAAPAPQRVQTEADVEASSDDDERVPF